MSKFPMRYLIMKWLNYTLLLLILLISPFAVFAWDGKCPICQRNGETSKVYEEMSMRTLAMPLVYYDEEGNYHCDDPNITTTNYHCSEGHKFSIEYSQNGEKIIYDGQDEN